MANNQFVKKIILLNKEKICLSANTISNKFLRKIIPMNMISLWKYQEVVSYATEKTLYGNCQNLAVKLPNILLLIKHITKGSLFYK